MSTIPSMESLIGDPRKRGGICFEQEHVKILYDDSNFSSKARTALHIVIAHHMNHNCVEICSVHARLNIEAARIYARFDRLKNKIDPEDFRTYLDALKEEILQQQGIYKPHRASAQVTNELVLEYLLNKLDVDEDSSDKDGSFNMKLHVDENDSTVEIPDIYDEEEMVEVLDVQCSKPTELTPVKLDITAKPSNKPQRDPAMQALDFERIDEERAQVKHVSEFNSLRNLSVEELRQSLDVQFRSLRTPARHHWKRAIGRVMARTVQLPKMANRAEESCIGDWYQTTLQVRQQRLEEQERRRLQEERINAVAGASVPLKVDRQRLCYTRHSEESEKQKRDSIVLLGNGTSTAPATPAATPAAAGTASAQTPNSKPRSNSIGLQLLPTLPVSRIAPISPQEATASASTPGKYANAESPGAVVDLMSPSASVSSRGNSVKKKKQQQQQQRRHSSASSKLPSL